MPDYYNDGNLPYGSVILTINGVNYETDDFDYNEPLSATLERTSSVNLPNGAVYIAGFREGTATLQLATAATAIPAQFSTFSTAIRGVSTLFVITTVGTPRAKDALHTVAITFRKVVNP